MKSAFGVERKEENLKKKEKKEEKVHKTLNIKTKKKLLL